MSNNKYPIDNSTPGLLEKESVKYQSRNIYIETQFKKNMDYYHVMGHEEPHLIRRRNILEKHPEVKVLFGPESASLWFAVCFLLIQWLSIYYFHQSSWPVFLASCFLIGGTVTHSLHILIHDLTHYTCLENVTLNKLVAMACNFGQGLPSAITFGRYHSDHHTFFNIPYLDLDLPSELEIQYMKGPVAKVMLILLMPFFYGLRPIISRPLVPNIYEIINQLSVLAFDIFLYKFVGPSALLWLILGTYLGLSIHPFSGHLIAEHYEFTKGIESYDYLGWINFFNLNVGYHTEHHDFPMIPWTRLPLLRKMAPEFYENLPSHSSYVNMLFHFVFDGYMGPFSRIIRKVK